jgi:hypothetical protein
VFELLHVAVGLSYGCDTSSADPVALTYPTDVLGVGAIDGRRRHGEHGEHGEHERWRGGRSHAVLRTADERITLDNPFGDGSFDPLVAGSLGGWRRVMCSTTVTTNDENTAAIL